MHISMVSYNIHGHVICIYILYFVCCDNIYQEMQRCTFPWFLIYSMNYVFKRSL